MFTEPYTDYMFICIVMYSRMQKLPHHCVTIRMKDSDMNNKTVLEIGSGRIPAIFVNPAKSNSVKPYRQCIKQHMNAFVILKTSDG